MFQDVFLEANLSEAEALQKCLGRSDHKGAVLLILDMHVQVTYKYCGYGWYGYEWYDDMNMFDCYQPPKMHCPTTRPWAAGWQMAMCLAQLSLGSVPAFSHERCAKPQMNWTLGIASLCNAATCCSCLLMILMCWFLHSEPKARWSRAGWGPWTSFIRSLRQGAAG